MHIGLRVSALAVSALVAGGLTPEGSASAESERKGASDRPSRAAAAVRGLQLNVFGSRVEVGSSTATIEAATAAEARAAGVDPKKETVAAAKVDELNERRAVKACLPDVALSELVHVEMACGESRVQNLPPVFPDGAPRHTGAALLEGPERVGPSNPVPVDNGGPQAVGRGSAMRVELRDAGVLEPHVQLLRRLVDELVPVSGQTVDTVATALPSPLGAALSPLALDVGARGTDPVRPVAHIVGELVNGLENATGLLAIRLDASSAHANTNAEQVVSLAHAGGGHIDVLPGVAPGGGPLFSLIVGSGRSISSFDRATGTRTPAFEPVGATLRLGLPLLGAERTEVALQPEAPITLLAGTPLETTVARGTGRTVTRDDGSVSSYVDGVSVQALKGVKGGVSIKVGSAESTLMGPGAGPARDGNHRLVWILAAGLALSGTVFLLAYAVRRRRVGSGLFTARHADH